MKMQRIINGLTWTALGAGVVLAAMLIIPLRADAGQHPTPDPTGVQQDQAMKQGQGQAQGQDQLQDQAQAQGQGQGQGQAQKAKASAVTGPVDVAASNEGITTGVATTVDDHSDYNFLALSLMFPNAAGCFKGVQGGADDKDNFAGFFGMHILDKNCWADRLAGRERDIDLNARLKCGGKFYRNAIAFDVARKDRQQTCVDRVSASNKALMEQEAQRVSDFVNQTPEQQVAEMQSLRRQIELLNERVDQANQKIDETDNKCDRQWESCVRK